MPKIRRLSLIALTVLLATGCGFSSTRKEDSEATRPHAVETVVVVSGREFLANAVSTELLKSGVNTIGPTKRTELLPQHVLTGAGKPTPELMTALRGRLRKAGVDAVLSVWWLKGVPLAVFDLLGENPAVYADEIFTKDFLARRDHAWLAELGWGSGAHAFYVMTSTRDGSHILSGLWRGTSEFGMGGSMFQTTRRDAAEKIAETVAEDLND